MAISEVPTSSGTDPPPDPNQASSSSCDPNPNETSTFECNICLDTARDAVISMCGHLFCWPCLHQWLETRPSRQICPVCKSAISKEKVVPIYGRGSTNSADPREKVPPRPQGQRSEPSNNGFGGFSFGDTGGFQMSFGIGAFPFGFIASSFNTGGVPERVNPPPEGSRQLEQEQMISKFFMFVAIFFIIWLILA